MSRYNTHILCLLSIQVRKNHIRIEVAIVVVIIVRPFKILKNFIHKYIVLLYFTVDNVHYADFYFVVVVH